METNKWQQYAQPQKLTKSYLSRPWEKLATPVYVIGTSWFGPLLRPLCNRATLTKTVFVVKKQQKKDAAAVVRVRPPKTDLTARSRFEEPDEFLGTANIFKSNTDTVLLLKY